MDLGDFHTMVSNALRRGTTLDQYIPQQVVLAVQWMERNYTFKYMENFRMLEVVQNQRTIQMPPNVLVKAAKFIRLYTTDGNFQYLNKVEPEDLVGIVSNQTTTDPTPKSYYIVGLSKIVLDTVPAADWVGEGILFEYSDWPTELTATHPLLDIAADMLLAQTQLLMSINIMKDLRLVGAYKEARDEAVNTMTRAEDETKYGGESISMVFNPE